MTCVEADDGPGIDSLASIHRAELSAVLVSHHASDERRRTPLMLAYWWGKPLAAAALVNAGSDYQQGDAAGNGAAWYARRFGKGATEQSGARLIEANVRRLSMESVISTATAPDAPAPKRRRSDI